MTTADKHDAAVGAAAGLAAGLLALTIPGIGLVLAAGPLALAAASGAIAGGVFGGLRDIGIEEEYARGYERRIHRGDVLRTARVPVSSEAPVRAALIEHGAEDISFTEDAAAAAPLV